MKAKSFPSNVITSFTESITRSKVLIAVVILLGVANQSCSAYPPSKATSSSKKLNSEIIVPGDSVKDILGEETCSVIFAPTKVKVFRLASEKPSDNDKTIGGYKVEKDMGAIDKTYFPILLFLMADNNEYLKGSVYPAAPFIPEVAVEFTKKKEVVSIVFSFSGGQLQIVKDGKAQKPIKYYNEKQIMQFFQNIFNDKGWQSILNLK